MGVVVVGQRLFAMTKDAVDKDACGPPGMICERRGSMGGDSGEWRGRRCIPPGLTWRATPGKQALRFSEVCRLGVVGG